MVVGSALAIPVLSFLSFISVNIPHISTLPRQICREIYFATTPKYINEGGGGTVFSASIRDKISSGLIPPTKVVIKVGRLQHSSSLDNECNVLQYLNRFNVKGIET